MKILSIEEKAKRYDDVLKQIKECTPDENGFVTIYPNEIFPELKESEDEKIKNWIVAKLTQICRNATGEEDKDVVEKYHKACAWLEKQGEQKSQGKSALEAINEEDVGNANKIDDCSIGSNYFGTIDKAVSKSEIVKDTWYVCTCTTCTEHTRIWFNKGIAYLGNDILKYDLGFEPEEYQGYFRLWTIEDAKDGDVLAEDSCIFIIQKLCGITAAKTYCALFNDGDFDDGSTLYFDIDSTKPASKEQCELLFQKMKEAGYEWNKDKKELKKL